MFIKHIVLNFPAAGVIFKKPKKSEMFTKSIQNEDSLKTTDSSSSDDRPTVRKKKKLNNGKSSGVDFLLQLSKPTNEIELWTGLRRTVIRRPHVQP